MKKILFFTVVLYSSFLQAQNFKHWTIDAGLNWNANTYRFINFDNELKKGLHMTSIGFAGGFQYIPFEYKEFNFSLRIGAEFSSAESNIFKYDYKTFQLPITMNINYGLGSNGFTNKTNGFMLGVGYAPGYYTYKHDGLNIQKFNMPIYTFLLYRTEFLNDINIGFSPTFSYLTEHPIYGFRIILDLDRLPD